MNTLSVLMLAIVIIILISFFLWEWWRSKNDHDEEEKPEPEPEPEPKIGDDVYTIVKGYGESEATYVGKLCGWEGQWYDKDGKANIYWEAFGYLTSDGFVVTKRQDLTYEEAMKYFGDCENNPTFFFSADDPIYSMGYPTNRLVIGVPFWYETYRNKRLNSSLNSTGSVGSAGTCPCKHVEI